MTPEEQQAGDLARWLEGKGPPPADGVDPDVLEAVYALRPDLAPPPRVTADDILAGLDFGSQESVQGIVFDAGDARAERPPSAEAPELGPLPKPANSLQAPFWLGSGFVGLLAAAVVTLVLIPTLTSTNPELPPAGLFEEAPSAMAPASPPPPPGAPPPPPAASEADLADAQPKEKVASGSRERAYGVQLPAPVDKKADEAPTPDADVATGGGSGWGPDSEAAPQKEAVDLGTLEEPASAPPAPVTSTPTTTRAGGAASTSNAQSVQRQENRKTASGSSKAIPAPANDRPAVQDGAAEESVAADDLYGSRNLSNAAPLEVLAQVARPAKDAYDRREFTRARDLSRQALGTSGLSNVEKADLNWVLGLALQALGQNADARRAFEEAARLRGGK